MSQGILGIGVLSHDPLAFSGGFSRIMGRELRQTQVAIFISSGLTLDSERHSAAGAQLLSDIAM